MHAFLARLLRSPEMLLLYGRGIQFVSQLTLVLVLPKVLVPALYAEFNLLVPLASLGVTFAFGWLTSAVHRHVYEILDPKDIRFKQTVFAYYGGMSLVLVTVFFIISALTDSNYRLIPLLLMAMGLRDAVMGTLNMSSNYKGFFLATLGFAFSLAVFIGLCFQSTDNNLATYLIVYAALDSVLAVLAWNLIGVATFKPAPRFDAHIAARYFRYGLPLVIRGLPLWVMAVSDRYLLALWMPAESVAAYILSYQHAGSSIMLPLSFVISIIFPRILRIDKEQGEAAALSYTYKMLGYYFRYMPLIIVGACGIVLAVRYFIYSEYHFTPAVIIIIVLAHVIQGLTHFYNKEFELNGKTMVITKAVGVGALLNVVMNVILIPAFGTYGSLAAALSTLAAYSITVYILYQAREYKPSASG
jgi:O-antigen/teichoic acid export membrane protein